jgi:hypothetical protein
MNKYFVLNWNLKVIIKKIPMIFLVRLNPKKFLLHLENNSLRRSINFLEIGLLNGIILWHI